jgi:hypothetical protein
MSQQDSLEALPADIARLAEQVKKNSTARANTGRHVLFFTLKKSVQHLNLKTERDDSSENRSRAG